MWFWHHHNHYLYNLLTAFNIFFFPRVRFPITFLFEISSSCLWTEGLPSWPQPAPVKAQRLASAVGCLLVCWADISVYFLILLCLLLRHCSLLAVAIFSCCLLPFCFLFCHFSPVVCCHLICFVSISVCCCHFPVCVLPFLSVNCRLFRCVVPTLSAVCRIFSLAVRCPYLSSVSQKISVKTQSLLSVPPPRFSVFMSFVCGRALHAQGDLKRLCMPPPLAAATAGLSGARASPASSRPLHRRDFCSASSVLPMETGCLAVLGWPVEVLGAVGGPKGTESWGLRG